MVSQANGKAVSSIMRIENDYTAFCIDEAASFVIMKLKQGKTPLKRADNKETAMMLMKGRW